MANSDWLSRWKEEPVNSDPPEILEKEEEENWQETREAYELFKVEPIQKEGESDDDFAYRHKSWEFQKEEYQQYWKTKIKNYPDNKKTSEDKKKEAEREAEERERLSGLMPNSPDIKYGPRGGSYTEDTTKDGRPYRRYF